MLMEMEWVSIECVDGDILLFLFLLCLFNFVKFFIFFNVKIMPLCGAVSLSGRFMMIIKFAASFIFRLTTLRMHCGPTQTKLISRNEMNFSSFFFCVCCFRSFISGNKSV